MAAGDLPAAASAADTLGRSLRDLRISVTDRCQFRCTYCMPREIFGRDFAFLPREDLLTFEELTRLGRVFAGLGVRKLRLTGGEPLLRRDLERLVAMLAGIAGVGDIALTTNGALLARKARLLAAAGLRRVTVSLDSLDDAVFMALNDAAFPVAGVLDAIDAGDIGATTGCEQSVLAGAAASVEKASGQAALVSEPDKSRLRPADVPRGRRVGRVAGVPLWVRLFRHESVPPQSRGPGPSLSRRGRAFAGAGPRGRSPGARSARSAHPRRGTSKSHLPRRSAATCASRRMPSTSASAR